MTHYATVFTKTAPLSSDFARDFLTRKFGADLTAAIYERLPIYQRGPRKGQPKGIIEWKKCERGGWYRTGPNYYGEPGTNGYVMTPGTHGLCVKLSYDADDRGFDPGNLPEKTELAREIEVFEIYLQQAQSQMKKGYYR